MSDLRVLTDAELDLVGGGFMTARPAPIRSPEPVVIRELVVDILRILEPKQPTRAMALKD
jgi:hypothetical protein